MSIEDDVAQLEQRVSRLERQLQVETQISAMRDRDLSDLQQAHRGIVTALNALRETQLEQGQRLAGVQTRLSSVEGRLERQDAVLQHIVDLLEGPGRA